MAIIQVRVEDDLKIDATSVFEKLGLDLPTAIRMFLKRCVITNGIPFPMVIDEFDVEGAKKLLKEIQDEAKQNGLSDMTMDEINKIIKEVRQERKQRCAKHSE